ncbi:General transcription factor II-I repeat domain-containing protein 2B [Anthophora retusa]
METSTSKRQATNSMVYFKPSWEEEFFFAEHDGAVKCLVCCKKLNQLKRYNLQRHYKTYHEAAHLNYSSTQRRAEIERLKMKLLKTERDLPYAEVQSINNEAILRASYRIAHEIGRTSQPFSDGQFIKTHIMSNAQQFCSENVQKFEYISLSRSTVTRRIQEMADNIMEQLYMTAQNFIAYSLAIDHNTNVTGSPQLAIFIRGVDSGMNVTEELLDFCTTKEATTGKDILTCVEQAMKHSKLHWHNLVSVATDRAPSMVDKNVGFVCCLQRRLQDLTIPQTIITVHCMLHKENLCAKCVQLERVMLVVVSTINFIRNHGLKQKQFHIFLQELDTEYDELPYRTEVHWLSHGKALDRFFSLRDEIRLFMDKVGHPIPELEDSLWTRDLAFLSDVIDHLNILDAALQRKTNTIIDLFDTICAFKMKIELWMRQLQSGNICHFPKLKLVSSESNFECYSNMLQILHEEFSACFADLFQLQTDFDIIARPFSIDIETVSSHLQLELIDLRCNRVLKAKYLQVNNILEFYKFLPQENFPHLHKNAARIIAMFGSMYLCEQLFSVLKRTKSVNRNCLSDYNTKCSLILGMCQSFVPNIRQLVERKRLQKSHN